MSLTPSPLRSTTDRGVQLRSTIGMLRRLIDTAVVPFINQAATSPVAGECQIILGIMSWLMSPAPTSRQGGEALVGFR